MTACSRPYIAPALKVIWNMTTAELLVLLTGIGGVITALITALSSARKTEVDTLRETLAVLTTENHRLREEVAEMCQRLDQAEEKGRKLEAENIQIRKDLDAKCLGCDRVRYLENENTDLRQMLLDCGYTEDEIMRYGRRYHPQPKTRTPAD